MRKLLWLIVVGTLLLIVFLAGCQSTDTTTGATSVGYVQVERCATCHEDAGAKHQAGYDELYQDDVIEVADLAYSYSSSTHKVTFKMTKNGQPVDASTIENLAIYYTPYTGSAFQFEPAGSRLSIKGTITYSESGVSTSTLENSSYGDLSKTDGLILVYGRDETVGRLPARVQQAKYIYASALETGAGVDYVSAANNDGCEKCHTVPFAKHGYILGEIDNDANTDFYTCKACHLDNGKGGHIEWQLLVNDPEKAAEYLESDDTSIFTADELDAMAYETSLMNDVHMSHAMEFPYPQSMSNCATCHEGKLDRILTDENFILKTCKSCHPVNGPEEGTDPLRAPALTAIIPHDLDYGDGKCSSCHTGGGMAPAFNVIHTGYDPIIYADANGTKYSAQIKVSVDSASFSGNKLTVDLSASGSAGGLSSSDLVPELMIGLYGYDTKDFIVNGHDRYDSSGNGVISRSDGDLPKGAYEVGTEHAYFKTDSEAPGDWTVTADLSEWSDLIKDGTVRRVEIAILPMLDNADGEEVALNAVSRTFDLSTKAFDDGFYSDIVDVENGCNNCHDALATTFHSPDRGGSIIVCRMCHVTLTGGSHLEVQSRSIDSYVHAIHSGQAFDIGDIDFADPVETMHYEHHIEFPFPTHGITNCEACHNPGMYNVPDQAKSLPGILSASDEVTTMDRDIEGIPSYVTGPASRACGGCHRAELLKEDNAEGLDSFLTHTDGGGYLVENGEGVLDSIIKAVMSIFNKR